MKEKVVLAYSGGLDTTAIIPWLKENFDYEVICVCADCGQGNELDGLEETATAATAISGISAMKDWNWKILPPSPTTTIFLCSA